MLRKGVKLILITSGMKNEIKVVFATFGIKQEVEKLDLMWYERRGIRKKIKGDYGSFPLY